MSETKSPETALLQTAGGAAGGAGLLAVVYALSRNVAAVVIVIVGLALVAAMLFGYALVLKKLRARRAGPLQRELSSNAAAFPQGVNDPGRRARLDDLRKAFDGGVEKFRAAGKNVYTFPWYIVVGEPGGGKSEAIRQCGAGFPPGLQDPMQGTGGTINMNWWFTNEAVILDTAGRLMFEEVPPGTSTEWQKLLELLRVARRDCPVNGMLLVIPADSLMKDSRAEIDRKAGKIARQLDQIQRELQVRFPVFILVTKCDLIAGFNDFFNGLDDVSAQGQMLGWSNPAPLDEPFRAETVDAHLRDVRERLIRQRFRLLLDPVNTDDASLRRVDQIDSLYGLPDALEKLAPRLRHYLEQVFVAGAWSSKPLFLRGIYFTCAMQKGAALDLDLAGALGISVDALPQGRVWHRERPYFLKDLFQRKVFVEKGLVTRANNAGQVQRRRKLALLGAGAAAILMLGVSTYFGYRQLQDSLVRHRAFWSAARDYVVDEPTYRSLVVPNGAAFEYQGGNTISKMDANVATIHTQAAEMARQPIVIPAIFRPVAAALTAGDLNARRQIAARELFEADAVAPTLDAVEKRLDADAAAADRWTAESSGAYVALSRLAIAGDRRAHPIAATNPPIVARASTRPASLFELAALVKYAVNNATPWQDKETAEQLTSLQTLAETIRRDDPTWPAGSAAGDVARLDAIEKSTDAYLAHCVEAASATDGSEMQSLVELQKGLQAFRDVETSLASIATLPDTTDAFAAIATQVETSVHQLEDASRGIDSAREKTAAILGKHSSLSDAYLTLRRDRIRKASAELGELIASFPTDDVGTADPNRTRLLAVHDRLRSGQGNIDQIETAESTKATLATLNDLAPLLASAENSIAYQDRLTAYRLLNDRLAGRDVPAIVGKPAMPAAASLWSIRDAMVDDRIARRTYDAADKLLQRGAPKASSASTSAFAKFAVECAARRDRTQLVEAVMKAAPSGVGPWREAIAARAKQSGKVPARPSVPMTRMDGDDFDAAFAPAAAGDASAAIALLESTLKPATANSTALAVDAAPVTQPIAVLDASILATQASRCRTRFDEYRTAYSNYWSREVFDDLAVSDKYTTDWTAMYGGLKVLRASIASEALQQIGETASSALLAVGDTQAQEPVGVALKRLADPTSRKEADAVLAHWRSLESKPAGARGALLRYPESDFATHYFVALPQQAADDFAQRYWVNVNKASLDVLADEAGKQMQADLAALVGKVSFPLARDPTRKELAPAELPPIRELVARMDLANFATDPKSLAASAESVDPDLDESIVRLRGKSLADAQVAWLRSIERRLDSLPNASLGEAAQTCSVTALPPPTDKAIEAVWPFLKLRQGDREFPPFALRSVAGTKDARKIAFPGEKVTVLLAKDDSGADRSITIDGVWGVFRLLELPGSAPADAKDPSVWNVTLTVTDQASVARTQQLRLTFAKPVFPLMDPPQSVAP